MKILKIIFIIIWTISCFIGIARNYWHYDILDWLIISLFVSTPYLIIWFSRKKKTIKSKNKIPISIKKIFGVIFLINFGMSVCFSFMLWKDGIFPSILICSIWGIGALLLLKKPKAIIQQKSKPAKLNQPASIGRNRKKEKHIVVSIVTMFIFAGIFISIIAYNKNSNNIPSNISEIEIVTTLFEDSFPTETLVESQTDIEMESSYTIQTVTESDNSLMVWISSTGKKYHKKSTCSNMKGPYQVSLKRAIAMGRGPCKKCY